MEEVLSHVHASLNQNPWLVKLPGATIHLRNLNFRLHVLVQGYNRE